MSEREKPSTEDLIVAMMKRQDAVDVRLDKIESSMVALPENLASTLVEFERRILERVGRMGGGGGSELSWIGEVVKLFKSDLSNVAADPMVKETMDLMKVANNLLWRKTVSNMRQSMGIPDHVQLKE